MKGEVETLDDQDLSSDATPIEKQHDWERVNPSTAIIESIAEASDRNPRLFEPVYYSMDLEAVDAIFSRSDMNEKTLSFSYRGLRVTLDETGFVTVTPD